MNNELTPAAENLRANRDKLANDVVVVAGDAGELLKKFSSHKIERAKDALTSVQQAATHTAREYAGAAQSFVRTHPWQAVGAAALAGVLLGMLASRR